MSEQLTNLQSALAGRYVIERELGRGGMAVVYLARDERQGRRVAIKVLNADLSVAVGAERFQREIAIGSNLTHPHIVPLYESGDADGLLYYVMPYLEGETLRARLDREKQLPLEDAIRIACEVASALDYAHRHGVVHRDVKPANILLEDGHAVIADFGIARALSRATGEHTLTMTGVTLGTPSYMSPEQASAEREIDGRSDIYALGCVVYEMLAGQPPFTGPNPQAVMARHAMDTAPSIRVVRNVVPPEVEAAIFCAMAKSPADRFATAQEFADALVGQGGMGTTLRYTARWAAQAQRKKRSKLLIAVLLGILVPAGVVGGWVRFAGGSPAVTTDLQWKEVAVLYFNDVSRDKSLGHVADGLTESLIRELNRNRIHVRSEAAVRPYRGRNVRADSIARALKVRSIIQGDVDAVDDSAVRIDVRFVDGNANAVVGDGRYGFTLPRSQLLQAQDSLVREVARQLQRQLGEQVIVEKALAEASSVESWSQFQRAQLMRKDATALVRADSIEQARQLVASADSLLAVVERMDPTWAAPKVARAEIALRLSLQTEDASRQRTLIDSGLAQVGRALARDSVHAHALEVRGVLRLLTQYFGLVADPVEQERLLRSAERDLIAATDRDASRASAWYWLGHVRLRLDDRDGAMTASQKAYEVDAYLEQTEEILDRLYSHAYDMKRFTAADRWCNEGRSRLPASYRFQECQLWLMIRPNYTPAPVEVARVWEVVDSIRVRLPQSAWDERRPLIEMLAAVPIAKAGYADSAQRIIAEARRRAGDHAREAVLGRELEVQSLIGDMDRAIEVLRQYVAAAPDHRHFESTWFYDSLRADPRFRTIVR